MTLTELSERTGITMANLSILKTNKGRAVRFTTSSPPSALLWIPRLRSCSRLTQPETRHSQGFEHLLHRLFADVRLDITQIDTKGRSCNPSEWFVVPLEVINRAKLLKNPVQVVEVC